MIMAKSIKLIAVLFFAFLLTLSGQNTYEADKFQAINQFLDEMASKQLIQINSAIKPFSRKVIAAYLDEISKNKMEFLNKRQKNELEFFMLDYSLELDSAKFSDFAFKPPLKRYLPFPEITSKPVLFSYRDSFVRFNLEPIVGMQYWNNGNKTIYHRWNGLGAYGSIGKNLGFYLSIRDNYESQVLGADSFLTIRQGGSYKLNEDGRMGGDYSYAYSGINYTWEWGNLGLSYDILEWGNNYNGSNIFSGKTTPFGQLKLQLKPLKWFELNYVHGWLNSEVIDSSGSFSYKNVFGYTKRDVFYNKFLAANMITFHFTKNLSFSVGNSIIYSDRGIHPAYLIPVMFYNSADQDISANNNYAGQNSQFYFDVSSRQIKNLHIFTTIFVDEVSFGRMWDKNKHSNYFSVKGGFKWFDIFQSNLSLTGEITRTNPQVYKHVIPTTTFTTNNYNLGNYMIDNSLDAFLSIDYHPNARLKINIEYCYSAHGKDYELIANSSRWGLPFLDSKEFEMTSIGMHLSYFLFTRFRISTSFEKIATKGNVQKFAPEFYHGTHYVSSFGFAWNY